MVQYLLFIFFFCNFPYTIYIYIYILVLNFLILYLNAWELTSQIYYTKNILNVNIEDNCMDTLTKLIKEKGIPSV